MSDRFTENFSDKISGDDFSKSIHYKIESISGFMAQNSGDLMADNDREQ